MDACEEVYENGPGIEVINLQDIPSWFQFDSSMNDEVDVFSMTALSTLVFLSQRETDAPNVVTSVESTTSDAEDTKRLSLAYERLHLFPKTLLEQFSGIITTLDLSHNEFDKLDFLKEFHSLTTLICDHNNITSNTVLPELPRLQILWLNYCKISELYPWARYLRNSCPKLKYLSLMGNLAAPSYLNGGTFYEYLQYRLFMISLFPNLEHLDDRSVTPEQRIESQRLYRRPFLERLSSTTPAIKFRTVSDKLANLFNTVPVYTAPTTKDTSSKNIIV